MIALLDSHSTLCLFSKAPKMVLLHLSFIALLETKIMYYIWWRVRSTIERLAVSIQSDSNLWVTVTILETRKHLSFSSMTVRYSRLTMQTVRMLMTHHTLCGLELAVIFAYMIIAIRIKAVILISLVIISGQMEQLTRLSSLEVTWEDHITSRCQQLKHFNSSSTDTPFYLIIIK